MISPQMSVNLAAMKGLRLSVFLLIALCVASEVFARKGFGPGEQEWGYAEVRPDANMFWWLYYTTAKVPSAYDKPLVIWLQGGPGASSTSYGNFEELGAIDTNQKPRNYTWVKDYNVLFIDNPVGTGFSYVTKTSAYTTTNAEVAADLVECMRSFLKKLPNFANVPTYIATESYGGKMGAEFALLWDKAQKAGTIKSNLKGILIGDAWVSPIDSVMTWAPFLLATGMVDTDGYKEVNKAAELTKQAVQTGQWATATDLWSYTEGVISQKTNSIDFYNILSKIRYTYQKYSSPEECLLKPMTAADREKVFQTYVNDNEDSLAELMNGPVKEALGLTVVHGWQSGTVFNKLWVDFMKPVTDKVELLLNTTDIKVTVISGQLDLIVDTPGTVIWVENLKWKHANEWHSSPRNPLVAEKHIEGYVKTYKNLAMYWINRAGHMVPKDNPIAMEKVLRDLTSKA